MKPLASIAWAAVLGLALAQPGPWTLGILVNDVGAYVNAVKPDIGPDWQLRVQFQALLPTSLWGGKKEEP
jgi:hypothetical protein